MTRMFRAAAVMAVLATCWLPGLAAAQTVTLESYAGTWEGAAQTPNGDVTLRSVFKIENGKLGGMIESSMGPIPVASAALVDGRLMVTIDFQGTPGTLACKLQESRIDGIWEVGGNTGTFWLTRPGAAGPAAGANGVVGTWAGEVQIAGQVFPFTMVLRQSGETLGGEIVSSAGSVPFTSAVWKTPALQLAFPYTAGEPVTMTGELKDGKLTGSVDYNKGEAVGTFTAARKQ